MGVFKDLSGQKFGMWTVLDRSEDFGDKQVKWNCKCECGCFGKVHAQNLTSGGSKGCGCARYADLANRSATHGQTRGRKVPPTYHSWAGMKARCNNPKNSYYKSYGGRGISVCERWLTYENFFKDMGEKPDGYSIDRIDVNGNYSPENCKWSSLSDQANNKTNNHVITYLNETKTLQEWSKTIGISHGSLLFRIYKAKWPIEKAMTTPGRGYGGRTPKA